MSPLRTLFVLVVFVALGVIEIWSGFSRISALRDGRRAELVQVTLREHADLAHRLSERIESARRQARYVASLPETSALLSAGGASGAGRAAAFDDFLAAFDDVDALELVDAGGAARLRRARGGDGAVREGAPSQSEAPWIAADVRVDGALAGRVRVRLTLPPWLHASATTHALPGVGDRFVPSRVDAAAAPSGAEDDASGGAGAVPLPERREADGVCFASRVSRDPPLEFETRLPDASLDMAMQPLSEEYGWIVGSMIAFTTFVGLMGAFVMRLSQRAFRLRETEHYLRWIRRVTDRYRALMEGAADMILIVEPEGGALREANAAAREALDLPGLEEGASPAPDAVSSRAPPRRLGDLLVGDGAQRIASALAEVSERGGRLAVAGLRLRAASGRVLDVDTGLARVDLGAERVVQVSLRDVTQQREMERQLQTAERLSSLGLLTAGVAHEINNPLEGIGNYLVLAERAGDDAERRERFLGEVRRGLQRIRDIVQDLLSFARPTSATGRADLAQVVDSALGLAGYASEARGVRVVRSGLERPVLVRGDGGRLEQVVLNLVLNAARAMQGAGSLTIAARRVVDDEGRWVDLDVVDEGPGIPVDDLPHVFDPFFSRNAGTGLGLTVSFGIARAHGGTLTARNRPEGGASFTLRLPADTETTTAGDPT
ncbi:MAG: hypothetical protein H6825_04935 [Planctomycetes bacterium]|nr:hypothetical protein [Planctomycetota bacterium]